MSAAIRAALAHLDTERIMIEALAPLATRLEAALSRLPGFHKLNVLYGQGAHPILAVLLSTDDPADITAAEAVIAGMGLERGWAEGSRSGDWPTWVVTFPGVRLHVSERTAGSLFDPHAILVALPG